MESINPYVVIVSEDITEIESKDINDQIFIQEEIKNCGSKYISKR